MSQDALYGECVAAMQADAAGPLKGWWTWVISKKDSVSKETLIAVSLTAFDFVAKFNIPQIPDVLEVPMEAWLREQIRPLIETLYAS
jgi:hypothetical protein